MRVVHFIAPGPLAGAETVVLEGCQALRAAGHEVHLLVLHELRCPEHGHAFVAAAAARAVPTTTISVTGRLDLDAGLALARLLRALAPEVLHVHGYKALVYALATAPGRMAIVASHHGETGHDARARRYDRLARALYRRIARVVAVSAETAEQLAGAGVPRARLAVVPNPVALCPVPAEAPTRPEGASLLFVGRLSPEKALDVVLHALAAPSVPRSIELQVAGAGPEGASWQRLALSLGLGARVRFLGRRDDVAALLSRADALVLPSLREGLPLVVLEAAVSGVPVLASRVGGIPSVLDQGAAGVLIEPGQVRGWIDALVALPRTLPDLRSAARRGASRVRDAHAPSRWAEDMTRCYAHAVR